MSSNPLKILIIFKGGIGNLILLTPALQALRKKYPKTELVMIVSPRGTQEIIKATGLIDTLIVHQQSNWKDIIKLIPKIWWLKADLAISAQPGPSSSLIAILARSKRRLGFCLAEKKWFDWIYTDKTVWQQNKHELKQYFELFRSLNIYHNSKDIIFPLNQHTTNWANKLLYKKNLHNKYLIGLHPGSFIDQKFKRWPLEHFIELARLLIQEYQATIIIFGGPKEKKMGRKIKQKIPKAIDFTAQYTLSQTATLIQKCHFFVSNDSGLMHIAAAVKTPVFAIFGPTNPIKNKPWGGNNFVIRHHKAQTCYQSYIGLLKNPGCSDPQKYLKLLSPQMVFGYIKKNVSA